jgi:hypothetical protein
MEKAKEFMRGRRPRSSSKPLEMKNIVLKFNMKNSMIITTRRSRFRDDIKK